MGQLGDMFPGAKLRRETPDEAGSGQRFEPGPLDLDGGVIHVRPRPKAADDVAVAEADDRPSEPAD